MSLFQRIKTPFGRMEDESDEPQARAHAVGSLLRRRREELGLDLDSIGEILRIKPVYLSALEQGRAQDLPGPTYAIGFIRAYAQHLGLDGERVLDSYKAESAEVQARPDLSLPVPLGERSLPGGPIVLVALILVLCGYGTWYYLATGDRTRPERVVAVPAELQRAIPAPSTPAATGTGALSSPVRAGPAVANAPAGDAPPLTPSAPPPPDTSSAADPPDIATTSPPARNAAPPAPDANASSTAPVTAAASSSAPVRAAYNSTGAASSSGIDIRASADCWIQVRADDQTIVFSRVLKSGETYHVPRPGLLLRTGNAGALTILVDGKPAPSIGGVGVLRRNVQLDPEALLAGTAARG